LQRISQDQVIENLWTPSFYGYDGGGNVRQLTNSAGAVTDTYEYDAFGNDVYHTGTTPNNYLYRGEQYDSDLALYYLRARYYNPGTGRFLSRDPLDGDATQPATLHRYLYVGGDPVNLWDPRGRGAAEYQLTLIPGGTAAAVVLPELTAGAAQFLAVAQLYAGVAYLTAQDVLSLIAAAAWTGAVEKQYACAVTGLFIAVLLEETRLPLIAKFSVVTAYDRVCIEFYIPPPFLY
jgi:RHS repeat-associated protein